MKSFKPTKTEVIVFQSILLCILTIIYLLSPYPTSFGKLVSYSILIGYFSYLSGWIVGREKGGFLDFMKILVPAIATSIGAIWLLSSGYLNLEKANLRNDIILFEKEKDSINSEIKSLNATLEARNLKLKDKTEKIELYQLDSINFSKQKRDLVAERDKYLLEVNELQRKIDELNRKKDIINQRLTINLKNFSRTEKRKITIELLDKNLNILNDKSFTIKQFHPLYPRIAKFNKSINSFELRPYTDEVEYYDNDFSSESKESLKITLVISNKENPEIEYIQEVLYLSAEYQIMLYDYPR